MSLNERITEAIYNKYFENLIGCCEPTFNKLEESHKNRLIESTEAGIEALKDAFKYIPEPIGNQKDNDEWNRLLEILINAS